ncbi:MAG: SIS domain-containing protein, partial [Pseudomonadota bacterium]|nr:SIS domain-containing protein [Pseudomonadota bacterium]
MFDVYQAALQDLRGRCEASLQQARDLILSASGNIIVCGMGKSGLVGRKISATLSSTGTPSVFLHPAEAMHGDLGIVRKGDVMILISYSGETEEVVRLLPALRRLEVKIIAIVGQVNSTLGKAASICLDAAVDKEAC